MGKQHKKEENTTKRTLAILSERTANAFILYFFALREDKEAIDYF